MFRAQNQARSQKMMRIYWVFLPITLLLQSKMHACLVKHNKRSAKSNHFTLSSSRRNGSHSVGRNPKLVITNRRKAANHLRLQLNRMKFTRHSTKERSLFWMGEIIGLSHPSRYP